MQSENASSGNLEESVLKNQAFVVLIHGTLNDEPYYIYARIPLNQFLAFKEAEKAGDLDITKFGEILAHGYGAQPSEKLKQEMAQKYGALDSFEADLINQYNKIMESIKRGL
jgi:hypothetical protein